MRRASDSASHQMIPTADSVIAIATNSQIKLFSLRGKLYTKENFNLTIVDRFSLYSLTHLTTYSLTHLLTHSPTHLLTHSPTHSLT